jgi:hypothetical protein
VERKDSPFNTYAYLDSQRLKDTFFSPPKKRRKKKPQHKRFFLLPVLICLPVLLFVAGVFLVKYEFMVVARQGKDINIEKRAISLLGPQNLLELTYLNKDKQLIRKGNTFVYLSIPTQEKVGIALNLKKTIDLTQGKLFLRLKSPELPLNIEVIVRDNKFFSNSLNPLNLEVLKQGECYINVPMDFQNINVQNANLARINQIKLYFWHKDQENINRALIKDIFLVQGG